MPAQVYGRVLAARKSTADFGEFVLGWPCMPHHKLVTDALDDERIRRLMVIMPPSAAKTTWIGVIHIAKKLGEDPAQHIAYVTYNDEVAQSRSVAMRDTTQMPEYRYVYPLCLPNKKKGWGEKEWYLQRENEGDPDPSLRAAGLFGAVLAYHFNEAVLDDPHDPEEILSKVARDRAWRRVKDVVLPRLASDARMVVTGFRWAEDDIPGRLMEQGFHEPEDCPLNVGAELCEEWHVIRVQALTEDEEGNLVSYWPELWPVDKLVKIREDMGRLSFSCQYQGLPVPEEGNIYRWFPTYRALPSDLRGIFVGLDAAYTDTERSDWNSWAAWAYDSKPRPWKYLLEVGRFRGEMPEAEKHIALWLRRLKVRNPRLPIRVLVRKKIAIDRIIAQHLRYSGIDVVEVKMPGGGDKVKQDLSRVIVQEFENRRALIPENPTPEMDEWLHQHKAFPNAPHDDYVETTLVVMWHSEKGIRETVSYIPTRRR